MTGSLSILAPAMIAVGLAWFIVRRGDDTIYRSQLKSRADAPAQRLLVGMPLLANLPVSQAMAPPRLVIRGNTSIAIARRQIEKAGVPGAPVVDDEGRFEGTVALDRPRAARRRARPARSTPWSTRRRPPSPGPPTSTSPSTPSPALRNTGSPCSTTTGRSSGRSPPRTWSGATGLGLLASLRQVDDARRRHPRGRDRRRFIAGRIPAPARRAPRRRHRDVHPERTATSSSRSATRCSRSATAWPRSAASRGRRRA